MTKSVTQATKSTQEKREKKTYDGTPIPEGYVLAPVWLKRDFVNEASYIKSENLTTRRYAGITFLIGYVAGSSGKVRRAEAGLRRTDQRLPEEAPCR